ncbi:hypothetical protein IE077_004271 [Cardiosporidium cionae]|uniref:Uncharacterized protein n=1 Tax=Cardiosporidium cionae TaxID=476202 RepID=A0ABQ7J5D7_9APIC|nr:hypothetical protein IE077_004271 [Cardiosporidium cionae]|eukprot:KAF8819186.1 hypothetical protein IE077_004271 [Cardiosporidium cionae]
MDIKKNPPIDIVTSAVDDRRQPKQLNDSHVDSIAQSKMLLSNPSENRLLQAISSLPPTFSDLYIRPGTRVGGQVIPSGRIGGWAFAYDMRGIQPGAVTNYGSWYPLFYPYTTGSTFTYTPPPPPPVERAPFGAQTQFGNFQNGFQSSSGNYVPVQPGQLEQPASSSLVPIVTGNQGEGAGLLPTGVASSIQNRLLSENIEEILL